MKIKQLHLKKYKRFADITINLGDDPKRIVALVGPNGCGKSSVFDAMLFLSQSYGHRVGDSMLKGIQYHSLEQNPNYNNNDVGIVFDAGPYSEVMAKKSQTGQFLNTIFSFRSSFRFNGNLHVSETKELPDICANSIGASTASDIDQRIDQNYRRLGIKYRKYMTENDCRPSEAKQHILGELNKAIHSCLSLEIDSLGDVEDGKGTLFFKKGDTPQPFEFNVLSAGEKEVVDLLLDLYLRKDHYTDSIYIIDEPELHLNTAIQRKLLKEINAMVPSNCQIWVATHSIGFLRALHDEFNKDSDIIDFREDCEWAKKTYILTPMRKSRSNWQRIFSVALEDLAWLVSPRQIIYCEGRADPTRTGAEQGFDAQVYNTIFGETHPDTLFVSSGGNTELDQRSEVAIKILSKVFKDVEILVLKDLDMASGKTVSEETRRTYLENNPTNHRVLDRFEIENYLFDKEVLQRYCTENNLSFAEKDYDDFVKDIVCQNLKDVCLRIRNICGITTSINNECFKLNLAKTIHPDMVIYKELEQVIFDSEQHAST